MFVFILNTSSRSVCLFLRPLLRGLALLGCEVNWICTSFVLSKRAVTSDLYKMQTGWWVAFMNADSVVCCSEASYKESSLWSTSATLHLQTLALSVFCFLWTCHPRSLFCPDTFSLFSFLLVVHTGFSFFPDTLCKSLLLVNRVANVQHRYSLSGGGVRGGRVLDECTLGVCEGRKEVGGG